jgi:hypothetical protein
LIASLCISALILGVVNLAALRGRASALSAAVVFLVLAVGSTVVGCLFPAVVLQALFLSVCAGVCRDRRRALAWSSIAATVAAYALPFWSASQTLRYYEQLREQYPIESLDARLPQSPLSPTQPLSAVAEAQLAELDQVLAREQDTFRASMLERLHGRMVQEFVNSPGFGVARVIRPSEYTLSVPSRQNVEVPQPQPFGTEDWSSSDFQSEAKKVPAALDALHRDSVLDFVNPRGFGWIVPQRRQVAGLQPHHFSQVPMSKDWKVQSVELVGLLVHDTAVVYMTANLPRMQDAKQAPTRPLDAFESHGLEHLQRGENLYCREKNDTLRLLGALRNLEECRKCHGGERGDLLGAFSYRLAAAK